MQKRHVDRALYFKELAVTSEKYLLPFIEEIRPVRAGMKVLEIGCGEGSNLLLLSMDLEFFTTSCFFVLSHATE